MDQSWKARKLPDSLKKGYEEVDKAIEQAKVFGLTGLTGGQIVTIIRKYTDRGSVINGGIRWEGKGIARLVVAQGKEFSSLDEFLELITSLVQS